MAGEYSKANFNWLTKTSSSPDCTHLNMIEEQLQVRVVDKEMKEQRYYLPRKGPTERKLFLDLTVRACSSQPRLPISQRLPCVGRSRRAR